MRVYQFRHPGSKGRGSLPTGTRQGQWRSPRSARLLARALRAAALLVAGLGACAEPPGRAPRFEHLAEGFVPRSPQQAVAAWGGSLRARVEPDGSAVWLETPIPGEAWRKLVNARGNAWFARRTDAGGFRHHQGERAELLVEGLALRSVPSAELTTGDPELGDGVWCVTPESTLLRLPDGAAPPQHALLASFMERGHAQAGRWRTVLGGLEADGLPVWTGERVERRVALGPEPALTFRAAVQGFGAPGAVELLVNLDGVELARERLEFGGVGSERGLRFVRVPLPARGVGALAFEVRGDPAQVACLDPVVGPAEIGRYGARPWPEARPDVVVFLADTFRADNLAPWGGAPDVAPILNRLAERSRRWLEARATGVWTLPTHGSMFTGLYPPQHGAITSDLSLPEELTTLAEHLAAAGYRTAAVTEGAFVSRHYGMAQGFAWFEERTIGERLLRRTLDGARAVIDADDGRPLFLFVHTYRVHAPYRVGPEEDDGPEKELLKRIGARMLELEAQGKPGVSPELVAEFRAPYHGLYLDGVRALDAALGPWLEELETTGILDAGYLLFTSDHGEEFYEHGNRFHGGAPHEEKVRIPLLLHGPGIEAADVHEPVSQVDLAPTVAELCGLPPLPLWEGRSILREGEPRAMFLHNVKRGDRAYLAVVEEQRKVFTADGESLARGELEAAYDLETDPGESADLLPQDPPWARAMARRLAPLWERLARSLGEAGRVELDDSQLEDLRGLGYVE